MVGTSNHTQLKKGVCAPPYDTSLVVFGGEIFLTTNRVSHATKVLVTTPKPQHLLGFTLSHSTETGVAGSNYGG